MQTTQFTTVEETIYTEQLENGLRVLLLPKPDMEKTFGIFTADFGAADLAFVQDGQDKCVRIPEGTAHFLEHKLFDKGDRDVYMDFGKLGSDVNAYTNDSETSYYFTAVGHVEENIKLLLDFVQDPYLTDDTVEKEKGIISQEYQMYADMPDQRIYQAIQEAMFAEHPVRNEVLGTLDSINGMTKEQLLSAYHTFYHPSNMTLCISGKFDQEAVMELIRTNQRNKAFPESTPFRVVHPEETAAVHDADCSLRMTVSMPKLMLGVKEYAAAISPEQLGRRKLLTGMALDYFYTKGGPLYNELADADLIDSSFMYTSMFDKSFGYTMLGSNTAVPEKLAAVLKEQLLSLNSGRADAVQFDRLKRRTVGKMLRRMNSIENNAQGMIWYSNRGLSYFDLIPSIQALTLEDWKAFLDGWIRPESIAVCTILPE